MIYDEPIFFEKNRVFRVYTGGKLLGDYLGDGSTDCYYPEEWIASPVEANNNRDVENEGISKIAGTDILLTDLIREYKKEILGDKCEIGILVKFLDSAIRLPVQAHPDKSFSQKYFNSTHGKEESWIVLATRPGGCIYFGFKPGVSIKQFETCIDLSETDSDAMEDLLVRYDVKPGDVIFVPAKTVHAIGKGCLILEIQEPTDFTIQPEHFCGNYRLNEQEMYLGLKKEEALDCFDFEPVSNAFLTPEVQFKGENKTVENLIGINETENFAVNRITLYQGEYIPDKGAGIYVVIAGNGKISGNKYEKDLKIGDYFLLPYSAINRYTISGSITVAECFSR